MIAPARLWAAWLLITIADLLTGLDRRLVTLPAQEPENRAGNIVRAAGVASSGSRDD